MSTCTYSSRGTTILAAQLPNTHFSISFYKLIYDEQVFLKFILGMLLCSINDPVLLGVVQYHAVSFDSTMKVGLLSHKDKASEEVGHELLQHPLYSNP